MNEIVKMMVCLVASVGWAVAIDKWAPDTDIWLFVGLVPSLLLACASAFLAVRIRLRIYRR
jgi:predicted signal transduction protein with EAL and GGDEF domain